MKTLKTILIGVSILAMTVSCEKKWSCDCDVVFQNGNTGQETFESDYKKKKEAKTWCEGNNEDKLSQGGKKYTNCTLGNGSRG